VAKTDAGLSSGTQIGPTGSRARRARLANPRRPTNAASAKGTCRRRSSDATRPCASRTSLAPCALNESRGQSSGLVISRAASRRTTSSAARNASRLRRTSGGQGRAAASQPHPPVRARVEWRGTLRAPSAHARGTAKTGGNFAAMSASLEKNLCNAPEPCALCLYLLRQPTPKLKFKSYPPKPWSATTAPRW